MTEWGMEARVGKPVAKHREAMLAMAADTPSSMASSVMDSTAGSYMAPPSNTFSSSSPYLKGLTPSLDSRVAWEAPTLSPALIRCTSLTISMVPLLILVAIPRAWKKEVWEGSMPVGPAGTRTSLGATTPTRAAAPTLYLSISAFTSFRSPLVNTIPTLPTSWSSRGAHLSLPVVSQYRRMERFIMVFLPIRMTAPGRRPFLMFWNCMEPTLSAPTTKALS
mmetsp:Transcript_27974/g.27652  ORF Transcript_27974/g.27652 Transcript_27974/m.27652 type:complete len:221 (+) Transcript_27974:398-1060(+)